MRAEIALMPGSAFAVTHHAFSSGAGRTSDGNGSHASTLKSPSYTKSVSWQHYLVEVVVMSRNSPDTGLMILNNIRKKGVDITRSVFTGGETVVDYLEAFNVDLFLTTSIDDAQRVIDSNACAVAILKEPPKESIKYPQDQVRIAFDGDAVLFDESSEIVYKTKGINSFHAQENAKQNEPLAEGPYAMLLKKIARLQDRLPARVDYSPIRIALVTARNSPSELRVIKTLRAWGINVDEAFFLGGVEKTKILKAFNPHIFFDDQDVHLEPASVYVPSGRVPYASRSPLYQQILSIKPA
ncbi:TPA: 5'-nucleotidase [Escherichia coli]|nr:5'-nucleotidase [Escherichia coli]HDV1676640.1 5'-nucleotidase [Escherichia coli]HDV2795962.1 5'-nucleotidase [Escherichia coli]HDV2805717.1 5'-nucleotidase [Escherichia coli]